MQPAIISLMEDHQRDHILEPITRSMAKMMEKEEDSQKLFFCGK